MFIRTYFAKLGIGVVCVCDRKCSLFVICREIKIEVHTYLFTQTYFCFLSRIEDRRNPIELNYDYNYSHLT